MTTRRSLSWRRLFVEGLRCNLAGLLPGLLPVLGVAPFMAHLWLTERCSGACRTCTQGRRPSGAEPDTDTMKRTIRALKDGGIASVFLVGGDVLLRPDFFEIAGFCKQCGLRTHVTLNGYSVSDDVAGRLMRAGLDSIHISMDAMNESLDGIRGRHGAVALVTAAIDRLAKRRVGAGPELAIATTIMKQTIPTLKDVAAFAFERSLPIVFNLINFSHTFFATDFSMAEYDLSDAEKRELGATLAWLAEQRRAHPGLVQRLDHLAWVSAYFEDHHQTRSPCYQTMLKVCVGIDGAVRPCCSMACAGNLFERDLADIVRSREYLALVRKALTKECPGCSCRYPLSLDVSLASRGREVLLRAGAARRRREKRV